MNYKVKRVVVLGLLLAAEIVLSRFLSFWFPSAAMPLLKIGFAFVPVVIAALLYGPVWAGAVAGLGDLLGAILFPVGAYFPGFTLSAFLTGVFYGIFLYKRKFKLWRALCAAALSSLVCSMALDTLWLYIMFKFLGSEYNVLLYISSRVIKGFGMIPVITVVTVIIERFVRRYILTANEEEKRMLRKRARSFFLENGELRKEISGEICGALIETPQYKKAKTVFCFVGTEREIDTRGIIERALSDKKTVCVPLCGKSGEMSARKIADMGELSTGHFGILEPSPESEEITPENIDFAVIPSSACDRRRGRIGQGGGYYDRFLKRAEIYKTALCPRALVERRLPLSDDDVIMDAVITERGTL
ncbi:MAG: 5-formyltetrahydrofolate cyclo-ligase [Ruminococcaceae bacterium]|nr:5-formyltetrahydrofolate cyclo-ligase [Oscillospiraceae bacterium]